MIPGGERIGFYADILFLIDFSMDFLTLTLAGRAMKKPLDKKRLLLGAAFGGLSGVILTAASPPRFAEIIAGILTAAVMTRIGYGRAGGIARLLWESVTVWGAGALLGGIVTFLMYLGTPVILPGEDRFPTALVLSALLSLVFSRFHRSRTPGRTAMLRFTAGGGSYEMPALCDSGCIAREPIGGLPVVLVKERAVPALAERVKAADPALRIRAVPLTGFGGERVLLGVIPEKLAVGGRETEAVVALDPGEGTFGGADAIVPE
ncbi:MAG: sigma-E processing peptidase SpoIIGA [Clostridia bacterium]|nr:sigma-E processing peptidase SpoIIGA [Clostridia bacterium]